MKGLHSEQEPLIREGSTSYHSVDGDSLQLNVQGESPVSTTVPLRDASKEILEIAKKGLQIGLSYTFSLMLVELVIFMGHLGDNDQERENYLDASPLLASFLNTLLIISIAHLFSVGIETSRQRGQLNFQKEYGLTQEGVIQAQEAISDILKNGIVLSAVVAPLPVTAMFFSKEIMIGLGQGEVVAELVQSYSQRYAAVFPALLFRVCFEQVMFGFEKQAPAMVIGLVNLALGTLLAGILGFNGYGLPGIAYGFAAEAVFTCLGYGLYLGCRNEFKEFNFFRNFTFSRKDRGQIHALLKIGVPITVTVASELVVFFVVNVLAGLLGSDALAAWDFASWISFFSIVVSLSTAQVTSQKVSAAVGEKKYLDARQYAIYGLPASLLMTVPVSLLLAVFPEILTGLIASNRVDEEVMSLVRPLLAMMVPIVALDGMRNNMLQTLRAVGDNVIPSVISTGSLWFGILMAYLLGFKTDLGIYGVGAGYGIGMSASVISIFSRWENKTKPNMLKIVRESEDDTGNSAALLSS